MTADTSKSFESFPIWNDVCRVEGRELYYDEESQSFFDDKEALAEMLTLRSHPNASEQQFLASR